MGIWESAEAFCRMHKWCHVYSLHVPMPSSLDPMPCVLNHNPEYPDTWFTASTLALALSSACTTLPHRPHGTAPSSWGLYSYCMQHCTPTPIVPTAHLTVPVFCCIEECSVAILPHTYKHTNTQRRCIARSVWTAFRPMSSARCPSQKDLLVSQLLKLRIASYPLLRPPLASLPDPKQLSPPFLK